MTSPHKEYVACSLSTPSITMGFVPKGGGIIICISESVYLIDEMIGFLFNTHMYLPSQV